MQNLVAGLHKFHSSVFNHYENLFARLADGQTPGVLFLTCSDSRIDPNLVMQTKPGDLFIIRNAGNIIPADNVVGCGELASIEFAIEALKIRDIVVCGHTDCGAMKAVIADTNAPSPFVHVHHWLKNADRTRKIIRENYQHLSGDALVTAAAEENVLVQIEHLVSHDFVAKAWESGRINIHGWMYHIGKSDMYSYDHQSHAFTSVRKSGVRAIESLRPDIRRVIEQHVPANV